MPFWSVLSRILTDEATEEQFLFVEKVFRLFGGGGKLEHDETRVPFCIDGNLITIDTARSEGNLRFAEIFGTGDDTTIESLQRGSVQSVVVKGVEDTPMLTILSRGKEGSPLDASVIFRRKKPPTISPV